MHSVPELAELQTVTEAVAPGAEVTTWAEIPIMPTTAGERSRPSAAGLWRRTARLRGKLGSSDDDGSAAERALSLEVVLLRERVARLTADIHRPVDAGAVIERVRRLTAGLADADREDEDIAWSALSECLSAREALAQATLEIEVAISAAAQRLGSAGEIARPAPDLARGAAAVAGSRGRPAWPRAVGQASGR
jgi:hypothetical protein